MIVVSDTSPISYLHKIGRLGVLRSLYGEIVVPPRVADELRSASVVHAGLDWSFLRVVSPRSRERVVELSRELDSGESEAIVVALELDADLLLIDERTGRAVAKRLGLKRIGLLGVLLEAKARGIISSVTSEMDRLIQETNFRVRQDVREEVRRLAGE